MCEYCRSSPCDFRCPNADEPQALYECPICEDGIFVGESMTFINDEAYHVECLETLSTRELLELLGCVVKEAGESVTARRS